MKSAGHWNASWNGLGLGTAIVSPSYRVTFETVRRTYCALSILAQDTPTLVDMVLALEHKPDGSMARSQMAHGMRFPINLLGKQALDAFPPDSQHFGSRYDLKSSQSAVSAP